MSEIDCYSGNIIHDLDDGAEGTHSKLADGAKPGVTDTPEGHATIQRDLNRMVKWADRNLKQLRTRGHMKLYTWRGIAPDTSPCWGLTSSSTEKDLGGSWSTVPRS